VDLEALSSAHLPIQLTFPLFRTFSVSFSPSPRRSTASLLCKSQYPGSFRQSLSSLSDNPRVNIVKMSGEAWLYLFAVLINAVNLFLQVFFTIMYSDLEW
jgi:hypothetical protein